jgi:hypothetical protein
MDQRQIAVIEPGASKMRAVAEIEIIQMKSRDTLGVEADALDPFASGCNEYAIERLRLPNPWSMQ